MNSITNTENSYKKLKYSYNPEVTFELTKEEGGKKNKGWILTETNWDETSLSELVKTVSYHPSKLKNGHKNKENVEEVYSLTLDFDKNDPTGAAITPFTASLAALAGGLAVVEYRTSVGRGLWATYADSVKTVYTATVNYLGQIVAYVQKCSAVFGMLLRQVSQT